MNIRDQIKRIIDRLFWGDIYNPKEMVTKLNYSGFYYSNLILENRYDAIVKNNFKKQNEQSLLFEHLFILKGDILVDPDFGWHIYKNRIVKFSFNNGSIAMPSLKRYLKHKLFKGIRIVDVDEVLSFRQHAEENYFHFISDILPRLWYLEKIGVNFENLSIIVSPDLYKKEYFRFVFTELDLLKNINIIISNPAEYVRCKKAYFVLPRLVKSENLLRTKSLIDSMNILNKNLDRLYIYRKAPTARSVKNIASVIELLKRYGFVSINFDELILKEQISYMKNAKYLIFDHGASVINSVFSENLLEIKLLEIMPINRLCTEFYWMSKELKINHSIFLSSTLDANSFTEVDTEKLEIKLNEFFFT